MKNKYNIKMAGPWITNFEKKIVNEMMSKDWDNYDFVEKFESKFAKWHNRKYCLMTTCCTHAIHLILLSLNVKKDDEIIIPEITWTGSSAPITYCQSKPVFADVTKKDWCLDPVSVENNINKKTKAIICVNIYGNMPEMKELMAISKKYNIPLIEDAAEALGSKYNNIKAGKFGLASVHSFHRTKTICTGEGGCLLTDNKKLYDRAKFLRDHGRSNKIPYYTLEATPKYMPNNLQASLALAQFKRINSLVSRKRYIFKKYKKLLSNNKHLQFNIDNKNIFNGAWATSIIFGKEYKLKKKIIIKKLSELHIPVRPFFYPLSSLPAYSFYKTGNKLKNPIAYDLSQRGITLPSHYLLTDFQIRKICDGINKILKK